MTADTSYDWIRTRLRELGAGTLSPDDKARLEQIAQADPFVADALEGYAAVPTADHAAHLDHITQHIRQPRRERRRWLIPNLTVTAIAAVFMILVGTWAVVRWSGRPAEESHVVILSTDSLQAADTLNTDIVAIESDTSVNDQPVVSAEKPEKPAPMTPPSASDKSSRPILPGDADATISGPLPSVSATGKAAARAKGTEGAARFYDFRLFTADSLDRRVPAEYTIFLIPTTQRIRPDRTGATTGLIPDISIATHVVVDYGPHGQRTYAAWTGNSMWPMRFPPTAPGTDKRETALAIASPVNGYPAFVNALQSQTRFPFENNLKYSTYTVALAFRIDARGRPEQITSVAENVPAEFVDEATRLLIDGPDWTCPDGPECSASFTFFFKKPAR